MEHHLIALRSAAVQEKSLSSVCIRDQSRAGHTIINTRLAARIYLAASYSSVNTYYTCCGATTMKMDRSYTTWFCFTVKPSRNCSNERRIL